MWVSLPMTVVDLRLQHLLLLDNLQLNPDRRFHSPLVALGGWNSAALTIGLSPSLCCPNDFCYRLDDLRFHHLLHLDNFLPQRPCLLLCLVDLGGWNSAALVIERSPSLCNPNDFGCDDLRFHHLLRLDDLQPNPGHQLHSLRLFPWPGTLRGGIGRSPSLCCPNDFGYRLDDLKFHHHLLHLDSFPPQILCPLLCPVDDGGWNSAALVIECSLSPCDSDDFGYRLDDLRFYHLPRLDNLQSNPGHQLRSPRLFP